MSKKKQTICQKERERLAGPKRTFQQTINTSEGIHLFSHQEMQIKARIRCCTHPLELLRLKLRKHQVWVKMWSDCKLV